MLSGLFALYIVLFAILTQTEALVPSDIDPATYTLPVPPPLAGPLTPNTKLTTAQKLFDGLVSGSHFKFNFYQIKWWKDKE